MISKRNTPQRRHAILALLSEQGEVSVDALAKRFSTSEVTIRKDLAAMESHGLLLRRYGGAVPMPQELIGEAAQPVSPYKQAIGRAAAASHPRACEDHHRQWQHHRGDDPRAWAQAGPGGDDQLAERGQRPARTGARAGAADDRGTWDPHSESFQGQVAEQVLRSYDFDQLFIGADGIDLERRTTTFNELLGLSRVMAEVAREVIVMAEADKVGRRIPNQELPWSSIHTLITDERLEPSAREQITARGVTLICTPVEA